MSQVLTLDGSSKSHVIRFLFFFFDTSEFQILQLQKFSYNEDLQFSFCCCFFFKHFINTPEETL